MGLMACDRDDPPSRETLAPAGPAFEERWTPAAASVALVAAASDNAWQQLQAAAPSPAPPATAPQEVLPKATAMDIAQYRAELRRKHDDSLCEHGRRYYHVGQHEYWRCRRS
jgi:hypothetical protein